MSDHRALLSTDELLLEVARKLEVFADPSRQSPKARAEASKSDFWAWDGPPVRRLQASLHKKRAPARRQYAELYGREAWHWDENC